MKIRVMASHGPLRRGLVPFLVYRNGDEKQQIVDLGHADKISIGRDPGNDLALTWDGKVSRVHAQLERMGSEWTLADEGLSQNGQMHPIQTEFVKLDALQCGFCTPGMVMACKALLDHKKDPSLVEIKRGLSGNICRCGTYTRIFAAVQAAAKQV